VRAGRLAVAAYDAPVGGTGNPVGSVLVARRLG
jgi:hypothetical protein